MSASLSIGVVVVNWDTLGDTRQCINAVRASTHQHYELFVVDNAFSDGSVAALRHAYPEATVIANGRNLGFAGGYNVGIRAALEHGRDAVLLLNDDTVVAPGALRALAEAARAHPRAGFLGPKICTVEDPQVLLSAGGYLRDGWKLIHRGLGELDRGQFDTAAEVECLSGCALLVTREAIEEIGLLDEDFFAYYEDVDWCYRARQAGLSLLFVPQATVWHPDTRTRDTESPLVTYYTARNSLLFARRHGLGAVTMAVIMGHHTRTLASWSLRPRWRHKRKQRDALLHALADFATGRCGAAPGT